MPPSPDPGSSLRWPSWRVLAATWVTAWFVAGLIAAAAALSVIEFGLFDATARRPHYPPVAWAAHAAFKSSVRARAGTVQPPSFTPAEVRAGFHEYQGDCQMCHGGPGVARADFVKGMTPTPPFVIDSARNWTPAQLYWIVGQGIKMTAMPGWRTTLTKGQTWDLVAFLEALPYLSPQDYARMAAADRNSRGRPAGHS